MKWTGPVELRAQLQKLWERGDMLTGLVTGEALFPKRLVMKVPNSAEMSERFDDVRGWISELRALPHCRVELREFRHRVFGANAVPHEVWIDTLEDALALTGRQRQADRFSRLIEMTRIRQPLLLDWLAKRPLRALDLFDEWSRLLEVVIWIQNHPRPGLYLRQVDIPGVNSKFMENQRGVLTELLDMVLPPEAIDLSVSGVSRFASRYGFRDKPLRIRFRMLDSERAILSGGYAQDITMDVDSFTRLAPNVSKVFITENEINFLAFPQVKDSLVIFGAGYGFEMLSGAEWLRQSRIYYWGDIDTHGFAILDQLRSRFNHVESLLMDRPTLLEFESQWGLEEKQVLHDLTRLNREEMALYDDLRDNRIRKKLRLEQERIGFRWVESAIYKSTISNANYK